MKPLREASRRLVKGLSPRTQQSSRNQGLRKRRVKRATEKSGIKKKRKKELGEAQPQYLNM